MALQAKVLRKRPFSGEQEHHLLVHLSTGLLAFILEPVFQPYPIALSPFVTVLG